MAQTYKQFKKEQDKLAKTQVATKRKELVKKVYKKIPQPKNRAVVKTFAKAYKPSKTLSSTLLGYANSGSTTDTRPVGRPAGVVKHRSPFTGKPVPSQVYYAQVREVKRQQQDMANQVQLKQQMELAKKGVPPNQIQSIIQKRMEQQFIQQQIQKSQQRQMPQQVQQINPKVNIHNINQTNLQEGQVIQKMNKIWKFQRGTVGYEGSLNGRVKKIYGLEESFFN